MWQPDLVRSLPTGHILREHQAEIGSGSGMAAGAICYIKGGDTDQIGHACAMALKNLMGLVCDPVGGLVEVPCVKRNVGGAVNALAAADMALAGITSKVPVDQVIDAMKEVGDKMDVSLLHPLFKRALFLNRCYENKRVLYRIICCTGPYKQNQTGWHQFGVLLRMAFQTDRTQWKALQMY